MQGVCIAAMASEPLESIVLWESLLAVGGFMYCVIIVGVLHISIFCVLSFPSLG